MLKFSLFLNPVYVAARSLRSLRGNNEFNARALIGQSAMGYCAGKPMENSRVLRIYIFFSSSTNIPRGLPAYSP